MFLLSVLGQVQFGVDQFFDIYMSWPLAVRILFVIIIMGVAVMAGVKYTGDVILLVRQIRRRRKQHGNSILNHSLFSKCESWTKYKINELRFGDEVRNRLFRTIISTKIRVISQKLAEGADEVFVNGDSLIPGARALEPLFKARMFAPVEA